MGDARIVIRERGYFSLPRSAAQDDRLALETRGLLALMLSLPPDWDYTVTGLAVKAGCGRDKMRRMVRELEAVGYLVREQAHDEGGRFDGNVYVLQETPPLSGKPDNGETARESPTPLDGFSVNGEEDNSTVVGKHRQRCEPSTAEPSTGFKAEQIREEKIMDRNIPPYSPPKGDGAEPRKQRADRDHRPGAAGTQGLARVAGRRRHPVCLDLPQRPALGGCQGQAPGAERQGAAGAPHRAAAG